MRRKLVTLIAVVSAGLMILSALASANLEAAPLGQGSGPELLKNPGLDGPMWFKSQCCGPDGLPINEVQIADGWTGWWLQTPPSYIVLPENCQIKKVDYGCYWMRPEFVDSVRTGASNRIYSGNNSQKYFSFGRMHEAGLYQRVTSITPGTLLRFSVYMSAWMCVNPEKCKGGYLSDQPTTMHLRVGIDPTGGTSPLSSNVVWSVEVDSFDRWTQYSVETVAQSDSVTVFTHSRPEWMSPRQHNDVYVDEASLTAIGTPEPSPTATGGENAAPAAPPANPPDQPVGPVTRAQNVVRPDGSTVHTVQPGDTLFGMALAYGVTVDQIIQLNHLNPGDFLQIGQEVVIKGPTNPATPAPAPQPAAAPVATALPQPTAVAAALSPGGLCIQAFNDRNGNSLYDNDEELVANVKFTVMEGEAESAAYTTNGIDEPHCFSNLPSRAYTVRIEPPKNYVPTTDEQVGVALAAGQTASVSFGAQPSVGRSALGAPGDLSSLFAQYRGIVLGVGGIGLLLVAGMVGFVVISRRK
jgi:LysM domain